MSRDLDKYFFERDRQNKISHAFLLYNSTYSKIQSELSLVISKYILKSNTVTNCDDVIIIRPETDKIVKEQISNLQVRLKSKSQYNESRVYIIDGAEKMNDYAANSLLKFLEEPENGIFAFLVTSNIENVLPTIKSRCQLIKVNDNISFNIDDLNEELVRKVILFAKCLSEKKIGTMAYLQNFIDKKQEKCDIIKLLEILQYFYYDVINYKIKGDYSYFHRFNEDIIYISSLTNLNDLVNKMIVLNAASSNLKYNLNINLFFDKLVIDLVGDKNEQHSSS